MIFLTLAKTIKTSSRYNGSSNETIYDLMMYEKIFMLFKKNYSDMA